MRYYQKAEKGFILFTVLLLMQLIALFSLYELQHAVQTLKMSEFVWQREKYFLLAQHLLDRIQAEVMRAPSRCFIPLIASIELSRKPGTWWQVNACHDRLNKVNYDYVVEALGQDRCAIVSDKMIAEYYRVTMRLLVKRKKIKIILQRTLIKPIAAMSVCTEMSHVVKIGQQIQREI